ncbi:MAG TPA: hypothetical protein VEC06_03745 [Paucimonas sp.]|nr:hypothetical protein [Paucimonas sp.]
MAEAYTGTPSDVVPAPSWEAPAALSVQLSLARPDITHDAVLGDSARFGFGGRVEAARYPNILLERIEHGFALMAQDLTDELEAGLS